MGMALNPPGQYRDDRNLSARQRLWAHQEPYFDIVGWVLGLARVSPGTRVLDAGCGNGMYLRALEAQGVRTVGCDLSPGMLRAAGHRAVACADVSALPLRDAAFDVVLAVHMLYHVPEREAAMRELRRVLAPGGTCVVVTNGAGQLVELRSLAEQAVRQAAVGWRMRPVTRTFTAENAAAQLSTAFGSVTRVRPPSKPPVVIRDSGVAADYVASWGSFYQEETADAWPDVVGDVRARVQAIIDREGAFITYGDLAAFVCR
jgi:ubiquinone/menaquinone biosynthesis C-methylase UbiE